MIRNDIFPSFITSQCRGAFGFAVIKKNTSTPGKISLSIDEIINKSKSNKMKTFSISVFGSDPYKPLDQLDISGERASKQRLRVTYKTGIIYIIENMHNMGHKVVRANQRVTKDSNKLMIIETQCLELCKYTIKSLSFSSINFIITRN
eukprot:301407_1